MKIRILGILCSMAVLPYMAAFAPITPHHVVANSVKGVVIGSLTGNLQNITLQNTHNMGVAEFTNLSIGSGYVVSCVTANGYNRATPIIILRDSSQITVGGELRVDSPNLKVLLHAPKLSMAQGGMLTTGVGDKTALGFFPASHPSSLQDLIMISVAADEVANNDVARMLNPDNESSHDALNDLSNGGYLTWHDSENVPLSSYTSGSVGFASAPIPSTLEEAGHKNLVLTKLAPVSGGAFYVITKAGLDVGGELGRALYDGEDFSVTQYALVEGGSGAYVLRTQDAQGTEDVVVELLPSDDFVTFAEAIDENEGVEADDAPMRGLGAVGQDEMFDPELIYERSTYEGAKVADALINSENADAEVVGGSSSQSEQDAEQQGFVFGSNTGNDAIFEPLDTVGDVPGFGAEIATDIDFDDSSVFESNVADNPLDALGDSSLPESVWDSQPASDEVSDIVQTVSEPGDISDGDFSEPTESAPEEVVDQEFFAEEGGVTEESAAAPADEVSENAEERSDKKKKERARRLVANAV